MTDAINFPPCGICGAHDWRQVYSGAVRDGAFGSLVSDGVIAQCENCRVQRLDESLCPPGSFYETDEYREKLQQELNSMAFLKTHDALQIHTLNLISPQNLRGLNIADIGCAAGSLLDHLRGISANQIGIEPYKLYRNELSQRGYEVYPYAADAARVWEKRINLAFSMQVIEHTENPRIFLEEIQPLLAPGGCLIISTPNLDDILFDLIPDDFPAFFYRVVHRWYFNAESLGTCARLAGYRVKQVRHVHRYNMSNALAWLRDRRPTGQSQISGISEIADTMWSNYLEQSGKSDCLYMILELPAST